MLEAVNASDDDEVESGIYKRKEDRKPEVIYAHDFKLEELVMIVIGEKGEQHHVY
jgi:hypothetical protein